MKREAEILCLCWLLFSMEQGEMWGFGIITDFEESISKTASGMISQRQPKEGAGNGNEWGGLVLLGKCSKTTRS